MKRLVVWLAVGLIVVVGVLTGATIGSGSAKAQETPPEPEGITYAISGGGWGHGTGMSQYGAFGMGLEGYSWQEILEHYFTGIVPGQLGTDVPELGLLWVGLFQDRGAVVIDVSSDTSGYAVINRPTADGSQQVTISSGNSVVVSFTSAGCILTVDAEPPVYWEPGSCAIDFTWDGWTNPAPDTYLVIDGDRTYTYGDLRIRPNKPATSAPTGFHVTHVVDLERYLWGLAEVPYSWAFPTLEAQAVAGRSYAVNKATLRGHPTDSTLQQDLCWCHIYNTTRDQVYIGTNFREGVETWKTAVASTEGMVMTHSTEVFAESPLAIATFYSSSTFGHTEDSGVAFGSSSTPEYLVGVPDPWSIDPDRQQSECPLDQGTVGIGNSHDGWTRHPQRYRDPVLPTRRNRLSGRGPGRVRRAQERRTDDGRPPGAQAAVDVGSAVHADRRDRKAGSGWGR